VRNGRRAGTLIIGTAALLVVAGTIEGFVSPQRLSPELRIGIGALTAIALILYVGLAGRSNDTRAPIRRRGGKPSVRSSLLR
jgi:hypothetical protein